MGCEPTPRLSYDDVLPLERIACTDLLFRRQSRLPDHELENQALRSLMITLAAAPRAVPQAISNALVDLLDSGSAGIHLQAGARCDEAPWSAVAGPWASHFGAVRDFAPTVDAASRETPLLLLRPERHYVSLQHLTPRAEECLVVPVYVGESPVGSLWAVTHDDRRRFDVEDLRQMQSLATFAAAACQTMGRLTASEQRETGLRESQAHLAEEERALRETERQKDIFIATLAHELRQPVGAMVSAVAVLRQRTGERDEHQARLVIERQVNHLRHLLDDLRDLSSITEGKIDLEQERLDAREVIGDAVAAVAALVQARRHTLDVSLPDADIPLVADRTRLQQVLTNLLTNAAKFTPGGGRIALRAARDGASAVIEVADNGRGIAAGVLPRIFDVFVQEDGVKKTGLGIGLHVVRRLVELHGGSVIARSDGPGQGSTFTVTLPLARQ
jgi:signal transduction histidine kinase